MRAAANHRSKRFVGASAESGEPRACFKRRWTRRGVTSLFVVPGVLLCAGAIAEPLELRYESALLTVVAHDTPLQDILRPLQRATGVEIRIDGAGDVKVSARFTKLPLRTALVVLLDRVNYILVEEPAQGGSRVRLVLVLGTADEATMRRDAAVAALPLAATATSRDAGGTRQLDADSLQQAALDGNWALLKEALGASDPAIAALALDLVVEHNRAESTGLLLAATKSDQPQVRLRAIDLLATSESADEASILAALRSGIADADISVRSYAVRALAERGGPGPLDDLRRGLGDPDPALRMAIVESVVRSVPPRDARPLLELASRDSNEAVRGVAVSFMQGQGGGSSDAKTP